MGLSYECIFQFILSAFFIITSSLSVRGDENPFCLSSICTCPTDDSFFTYINGMECPKDDPKVSIGSMSTGNLYKFKANKAFYPIQRLLINCSTNDNYLYEILPQLNLAGINSIAFINCGLPSNSSLKLGIPKILELAIDYDNFTDFGPFKDVHFSDMNELKVLHFEMITAGILPNDFYMKFPNLKSLHIRMDPFNGNISIEHVENVVELSVSHIENDDFHFNRFVSFPNLVSLELIESNLKMLRKRTFEGDPRIERLGFKLCEIDNFEPDVFRDLIHLSRISFEDGLLKNMPKQIFRGNKLLSNAAFSSPVDSLPDELLADLPNLSSVYINYCNSSLPKNLFKNSSGIVYMYVTSNHFETLPNGLFDDQINLKVLDLSRNQLDRLLMDIFNNLKALEYLGLTYNRFKKVSDAVVQSPNTYIDLEFNVITDIQIEDLRILETDAHLRLNNNSISKFSAIEFLSENFCRLKGNLSISVNSFDCSTCEVYHLIQLKNQSNFIQFESLNCGSPINMENLSIFDVDTRNFNCKPTKICLN